MCKSLVKCRDAESGIRCVMIVIVKDINFWCMIYNNDQRHSYMKDCISDYECPWGWWVCQKKPSDQQVGTGCSCNGRHHRLLTFLVLKMYDCSLTWKNVLESLRLLPVLSECSRSCNSYLCWKSVQKLWLLKECSRKYDSSLCCKWMIRVLVLDS